MDADRHRIDLWLKLVCLFKQRSDATEACKGGMVKINGERCKPSAAVRLDDLVEIADEDRYRKVVVLTLPERPVSKEVARTMYRDETPPPLPRLPGDRIVGEREKGAGRPTKRERRDLDRFRR